MAPLERCHGVCLRSFHPSCLPDGERAALLRAPERWRCADCVAEVHECFLCVPPARAQAPHTTSLSHHMCFEPMFTGTARGHRCKVREADARLKRCSGVGCGKFYHMACLEPLPLTKIDPCGREHTSSSTRVIVPNMF